MQVTLKLSRRGPSVWFLGEPKQIKISLNHLNPGPEEVDFESLTAAEQERVIIDVKTGVLESSVTFQELYKTWANSRPAVPVAPSPPRILEQQRRIQESRDKVLKAEAKYRDKEEKVKQRCEFLLTRGAAAIRSVLKDEKDLRLFRTLLSMEQIGKRRRTVLRYLQDKLKRAEKEIAEKISRATKKQLEGRRIPGETMGMNVIESEQETIILTAEDLIEVAAKE